MTDRVLEIDDLCIAPPLLEESGKPHPAGISLRLNAGETALIAGLEHSGKSRLLAAAVGNAPSYNQVRVCGRCVSDKSASSLIGYVPAFGGLYKELTCMQYLSTFAEIYGVERHYRPYIIRESLALVRLDHIENTVISSITDEFKLRCLGIARALVHDPRLVVIDNVFEGVNNTNMRTFADILSDIRRRGKALLLAGRQLGGLEGVADQVCFLSGCEPFLQGWVSDIGAELADHHLYQLQLLGSSDHAHLRASHINGLLNIPGVIDAGFIREDRSLLRIMYRGRPEQFQDCVQFLAQNRLNMVACWEDSAFFAHPV